LDKKNNEEITFEAKMEKMVREYKEKHLIDDMHS